MIFQKKYKLTLNLRRESHTPYSHPKKTHYKRMYFSLLALHKPQLDHTKEETAANLNPNSSDHTQYIDMELTTHKNLFFHPTNSPPQSAEFEFKMSSVSSHTDTTAPSPADELFYKGKLLPLHHPLRLQMFEKLLQNSNSYDKTRSSFNALFNTPLITTSHEYFFDYSNESCHVSQELEAEEYVFCDSSEASEFINVHSKKRWTKVYKFFKQSSIGSKVKAYRAYLKSLFSKTSCCSAVDCVKMDGCSFRSRSSNLNEIYEFKFGERSKSFDSEFESSIQSAIAHCKMSSQGSVSDIEFCSSSGSRVDIKFVKDEELLASRF